MAGDEPHVVHRQDEWSSSAQAGECCQVEVAPVEVVGVHDIPVAADEGRNTMASRMIEVLAATSLEDPQRAAAEAGIDHHLVKPVKLEQIARLLIKRESDGAGVAREPAPVAS